MAWAKRLDLFSSVAPESQNKTLAGSVISICSLILLTVLIGVELRSYRVQRLNSRVFVMNLDYHEINFVFDIEVINTACDHLTTGFATPYDDYQITQEPEGNGCRIRGEGFIRSLDNELVIAPSDMSTFMQLFGFESPASMDLSHRIHHFQLGLSAAAVEQLSRKFPEIRVNQLSKTEFIKPPASGQHSVFYYEVGILVAKVQNDYNVLYTYTKNNVETWGINVFLKFSLDFSPIAIDYSEGREDFGQFLTYVCGILGGVLSLVRIAYNCVAARGINALPG